MSKISMTLTITGDTADEIINSLSNAMKVLEANTAPAAAEEIPEKEEAPAKAPKKSKAAKAAPKAEIEEDVDLEAPEESNDFDFTEEEPEEKPAPKLTPEKMIEKFRAYAGRVGKDKALAVLAKFKVRQVKDLKPEQYAKVLSIIE